MKTSATLLVSLIALTTSVAGQDFADEGIYAREAQPYAAVYDEAMDLYARDLLESDLLAERDLIDERDIEEMGGLGERDLDFAFDGLTERDLEDFGIIPRDAKKHDVEDEEEEEHLSKKKKHALKSHGRKSKGHGKHLKHSKGKGLHHLKHSKGKGHRKHSKGAHHLKHAKGKGHRKHSKGHGRKSKAHSKKPKHHEDEEESHHTDHKESHHDHHMDERDLIDERDLEGEWEWVL